MSKPTDIVLPLPNLLAIRVQYALGNVYLKCNLGNHFVLHSQAVCDAQEWACMIAAEKGEDVACPILFADEPELVRAWKRGLQRASDKRYRWHVGDLLPDASTLHDLLARGQRCEVMGHSLSPDEHGVWITSPYGIDCGLWQDLTIEVAQEFLIDMAAGKDYGPIP